MEQFSTDGIENEQKQSTNNTQQHIYMHSNLNGLAQ
jgi:hypothetical protein